MWRPNQNFDLGPPSAIFGTQVLKNKDPLLETVLRILKFSSFHVMSSTFIQIAWYNNTSMELLFTAFASEKPIGSVSVGPFKDCQGKDKKSNLMFKHYIFSSAANLPQRGHSVASDQGTPSDKSES